MIYESLEPISANDFQGARNDDDTQQNRSSESRRLRAAEASRLAFGSPTTVSANSSA
jgi:hypothetical protein